MRSFIIVSSFLVLLPFVSLAQTSFSELSRDELSELLGLTVNKMAAIRIAQQVADQSGAVLATYGGTSREIIEFVERKVSEEGSVENYRAWLEAKEAIGFLDWHRIFSDLDFLLFPKPGSEMDEKALSQLKAKITEQFPGEVMFKSFDIHLASEFVSKFPPQQEHFEAISNIPISSDGVVAIPELRVKIGSRNVDLPYWGLDQYIVGSFDFQVNPVAQSSSAVYKTYDLLRQLIRWVRYYAERPDILISDHSHRAMKSLLSKIDRDKAVELLREGNREYRDSVTSPSGKGGKLIQSTEKLLIYTRDSSYAAELLERFGIAQLYRQASIDDSRLLRPLRPRNALEITEAKALDAKKLGRSVVVNHWTSLTAAQNLSKGAIWMSQEGSILLGKSMGAAFGEGLYAAEGNLSMGYGDTAVSIELNPDAVLGVDLDVHGDYYVIKTLDAIARRENGELGIQKVDHEFLQEKFSTILKDPEANVLEKRHVARGVLSVFRPEESASHQRLILQALEILDSEFAKEADREVLMRFAAQTYTIRFMAKSNVDNSELQQKILELITTNLAKSRDANELRAALIRFAAQQHRIAVTLSEAYEELLNRIVENSLMNDRGLFVESHFDELRDDLLVIRPNILNEMALDRLQKIRNYSTEERNGGYFEFRVAGRLGVNQLELFEALIAKVEPHELGVESREFAVALTQLEAQLPLDETRQIRMLRAFRNFSSSTWFNLIHRQFASVNVLNELERQLNEILPKRPEDRNIYHHLSIADEEYMKAALFSLLIQDLGAYDEQDGKRINASISKILEQRFLEGEEVTALFDKLADRPGAIQRFIGSNSRDIRPFLASRAIRSKMLDHDTKLTLLEEAFDFILSRSEWDVRSELIGRRDGRGLKDGSFVSDIKFYLLHRSDNPKINQRKAKLLRRLAAIQTDISAAWELREYARGLENGQQSKIRQTQRFVSDCAMMLGLLPKAFRAIRR